MTAPKLSHKIEPSYLPHTGVQVQLLNIRTIATHTHKDALEFIYCLSGKVWGHVAHEQFDLAAGELVTIDCGDVRNIFADDDNLTLIVHISLHNARIPIEELLNTLFSCSTNPTYLRHPEAVKAVCDLLFALAYTVVSFEAAEKDRRLIDRMDLQGRSPHGIFLDEGGVASGADLLDADSSERVTAACEFIRLNLLDLMAEKFSWFSLENLSEDDWKYKDRLQKIVAYVSENCGKKITIAQLSNTIYLNASYISSFMQRTSFSSFTEMLSYYRGLQAQHLLLETELTIGEIASRCGFSSDKYFYKAFKRWWSNTPLQYRKQFQHYAKRKEECYPLPPYKAQEIIKNMMVERAISKACEVPPIIGGKV